MVRKITAQVKPSSSTKSKIESDQFDFERFFKNIWEGIGDNWLTYVWFISVIIGVIQLRQFIAWILFLTLWILAIGWFFDNIFKK